MSGMLNDTIDTAKNVMGSANEGAGRAVGKARHAVDSVREGADHAVSRARTTLWDRVKTVTEVVTLLRGFQTADALGWFGLARRRSPFLSFGIFGAGVALGAGAGVLFAPMSGAETRRLILARFSGLKQQAGSPLDEPVARVKEPIVEAEESAIQVAPPDHAGRGTPSTGAPHNGKGNGNRVA